MTWVTQSLMFSKDTFNGHSARTWARAHGYKTPEVEHSNGWLRLRQMSPSRIDPETFRILHFSPNIYAVRGKLKDNPTSDNPEKEYNMAGKFHEIEHLDEIAYIAHGRGMIGKAELRKLLQGALRLQALNAAILQPPDPATLEPKRRARPKRKRVARKRPVRKKTKRRPVAKKKRRVAKKKTAKKKRRATKKKTARKKRTTKKTTKRRRTKALSIKWRGKTLVLSSVIKGTFPPSIEKRTLANEKLWRGRSVPGNREYAVWISRKTGKVTGAQMRPKKRK